MCFFGVCYSAVLSVFTIFVTSHIRTAFSALLILSELNLNQWDKNKKTKWKLYLLDSVHNLLIYCCYWLIPGDISLFLRNLHQEFVFLEICLHRRFSGYSLVKVCQLMEAVWILGSFGARVWRDRCSRDVKFFFHVGYFLCARLPLFLPCFSYNCLLEKHGANNDRWQFEFKHWITRISTVDTCFKN